MKYTKQSFEEVLQEAYDDLEGQDIINLLGDVLSNLKDGENYNEFIHSVSKDVHTKKNISFKQWKALSAYLSDCRKKQNKTF